MKIPKVHAKKLKNLGKGLYECTDQRATPSVLKEFAGSSGGGGYLFYGYENKVLEYQKREARRSRYIKKKSAEQSRTQAVQAPIGTCQ
jgi:hypothetical protein